MGAVGHDCALGLSMTVRSNLAAARWDDRATAAHDFHYGLLGTVPSLFGFSKIMLTD
jgi:hypothetical protein